MSRPRFLADHIWIACEVEERANQFVFLPMRCRPFHMKLRHDMITCYALRASENGTSHEFLQLRRRIDDYIGGTWQAVSGEIEAGETAWQAAIRELREEADLTPVELYRLPVVNTFYTSERDTLWHSVPFCAVVGRDQQVTLNDEHDAVRWIPRAEVEKHFMWATDRIAILELCKTILDDGPAKPYLRIPLE